MTRVGLKKLYDGMLRHRIWRTVRYYIVGLYQRIDDSHLLLQAGGLAFALAVCIIPILLIVFSILGAVLAQPSIEGQIDAFIAKVIPYSDYADYVTELVMTRVSDFADLRHKAGIIGIVGLLIASTGLFSSMRTILNSIYRVQSQPSFLVGKLRDILLLLLVMLFVLLATAILPTIDTFFRMADEVTFLNGIRETLPAELPIEAATVVVIFIVFFVVYMTVPQQRLPFKVIGVSALVATILWFLAKELFGYYIDHFVTLHRIYGAYSLLIVVFFWVYYTAIVFVVGAEFGQLWRERSSAAVSSS